MTDYITLPISCKTVHKIINKCDYFINIVLPKIGFVIICGLLLSAVSILIGITFYLATHPIIATTRFSDSIYPEYNWMIYLGMCCIISFATIGGILECCDVKFTCIKEKSE